jgi:hypothetical protein
MSTFSVALLTQLLLSESDVLSGYDGWGLIAIPGTLLASLGQQAVPILGDEPGHPCNEAHVEIVGPKGKTLEKALRKLPWAVRPYNVPESPES